MRAYMIQCITSTASRTQNGNIRGKQCICFCHSKPVALHATFASSLRNLNLSEAGTKCPAITPSTLMDSLQRFQIRQDRRLWDLTTTIRPSHQGHFLDCFLTQRRGPWSMASLSWDIFPFLGGSLLNGGAYGKDVLLRTNALRTTLGLSSPNFGDRTDYQHQSNIASRLTHEGFLNSFALRCSCKHSVGIFQMGYCC